MNNKNNEKHKKTTKTHSTLNHTSWVVLNVTPLRIGI